MATPLANAAKRGGSFAVEPRTLAPPGRNPNDCTYCWMIPAVSAFDPLSAKPRPSRIDFFPSSITSGGMSAYFVPTINSPTYVVTLSSLGKGAGLQGGCGLAAALVASE